MEPRITSHPDRCNGRPIVGGTRITVQTILEFLGAGDTIEQLLAAYPALTRDDVLAALHYSSYLLAHRYRVEAVA